jgi:hypothetical protein
MRRTAVAIIVVSAVVAPLGCTKAKPSKESFCRELRRTSSLAEVLSGLQSEDPSAIGRKARGAAQQFAKLKRSAPREIRSDVTQVSDLVAKIAKAVEGSPDNPQAIATVLRGELLNIAGVVPAALRLIKYSHDSCHYDPGQPTASTARTTAPGTSVPATPTTSPATTVPATPTT